MTEKDLIKQWAKHPILLSESNRESYFLKRVFEDYPEAKQFIEYLDKLALDHGGTFQFEFDHSKRDNFEADTLTDGFDSHFDDILWSLIDDHVAEQDIDDLWVDDSDYDREYGYGEHWSRNDKVFDNAVEEAAEQIIDDFGNSLMYTIKHLKECVIDDTTLYVAGAEDNPVVSFTVALKIPVELLDI